MPSKPELFQSISRPEGRFTRFVLGNRLSSVLDFLTRYRLPNLPMVGPDFLLAPIQKSASSVCTAVRLGNKRGGLVHSCPSMLESRAPCMRR